MRKFPAPMLAAFPLPGVVGTQATIAATDDDPLGFVESRILLVNPTKDGSRPRGVPTG
jgi:hypothetical protein